VAEACRRCSAEDRKGVAVRKMTRQLGPMSRKRKGLRAVLREIAYSADRSALFWWMVEHHDELAQAAQGRRLRWKPLCERFAALGLTDVKGRVPSERTARATWGRARRAVTDAREQAANKPESTPKRKYPSRVSPDWRPQVVEQPGSVASAGPRVPSSASVQESSLGEVRGRLPSEVTEFPTVDPSGVPLPEGHVFYRGQSMLRRVAEQLARIERQAREMDRFK
jgi:hypothetical protein